VSQPVCGSFLNNNASLQIYQFIKQIGAWKNILISEKERTKRNALMEPGSLETEGTGGGGYKRFMCHAREEGR
jgi:hypothetical protein